MDEKYNPLELVKKAYLSSKNLRQVDLERFSRFYRLYRGEQSHQNYRGLATLFVPEPHRIVSRKTAKIVNAIKGAKTVPRESTDVESSKMAGAVLDFLSGKLSIKNFYRSIIKESRIVGLSWAKITWDVSKEKEGEQWRALQIEQFSVDRIFLNKSATILDMFQGKLEYLIAEYEASTDDLKKNKNYDKTVINIIEKKGGNNLPSTSLSQVRQMNRQSDVEQTSVKKHYIKEFWGVVNGKDRIIVVADDNYVLRDDENPYAEILTNPIPFVPFPASIEPFENYPIGDIEPNESLFNELNDTRNQRMDTVTLNIDPAKIVLRSAQIDEKELVAKRGWIIHSNLPQGITFVPPDMQGVVAAINEEKIIRGDIQQSTGVLDFAPQSDMQAGVNIDTARGAIIAKGESDVVTSEEIDVVKESLKMMWRIILAYSQEFLDKPFIMRLVQGGREEFLNYSKDAIRGNLDVDIEIETLQDETTRQQMSLMLFNQAKTIPGANMGKFFTDMLSNFKENVNIDEYYQEPQPIAPEPPKVSISLKGDLSELQAASIFTTIQGVDPAFGDPLTTEQGRQLMRGDMPETKKAETDKLEAETMKIHSEVAKNLAPENETAI